MGWTFLKGRPTHSVVENYILNGVGTWKDDRGYSKVLKWVWGNYGIWLLCERKTDDKIYKTITCVLIEKKDFEWGYKTMDVSCGPYYVDCPAEWLNEVASTYSEDGYFLEWSQSVNDYWKAQ